MAVMQESLSGSDTYSEVCASLGKGSSDSGRVLVGTWRLGAFSPWASSPPADGHIEEARTRLGSTVCWDHIDISEKQGNGTASLLTHLSEKAWRHLTSNNSRESWIWTRLFAPAAPTQRRVMRQL